MDLGERLFELRKSKNLSQEEVADKLNVTRQTVSKWETNQSMPDFDKILPLCELFEISTEELIKGEKPEILSEGVSQNEEEFLSPQQIRVKSAEVVSTSVFMYFLAVVFIMVAIPVLNMNDVLASALFLLIIGFATARIIKHFMSIPKCEEDEDKKENKILKQVKDVINAISVVLYFIISFTTMAWHITWIIFVIDGLVCEIVKLIFMIKEEESNEE